MPFAELMWTIWNSYNSVLNITTTEAAYNFFIYGVGSNGVLVNLRVMNRLFVYNHYNYRCAVQWQSIRNTAVICCAHMNSDWLWWGPFKNKFKFIIVSTSIYNIYTSLNLSTLYISPLYKIDILQYMGETFDAEFQRYFTIIQISYLSIYGWDILCGISKGTFEIPHKISYPYIERYVIHSNMRALRFKSSEAFLKRSPGQQ